MAQRTSRLAHARDIDFEDLDNVAGGVAVHALSGILPGSIQSNFIQSSFDPGAYAQPYGQPSAIGLIPTAPQGGIGSLLTGLQGQGTGLPPGYVAVPQSVLAQLQGLLARPAAAPAPVAAQPNPLTQIQQGLGIANQFTSLLRGLGGLGGSPGGASGATGAPQGAQQGFPFGGDQGPGPGAGAPEPDYGGYESDFGGEY